jgi:threonine/homoserine efflux transporter RhtA
MRRVRNLCRATSVFEAGVGLAEWRGATAKPDSSVWLVISGIVSVQVGAAIAKDLFDLVPPTAMVWLRLITSAVILLLMARQRLPGIQAMIGSSSLASA